MAIYEYECPGCGKRFELTMGMTEHDHLKKGRPKCPECGKPAQQLASDFSTKAPGKY
jgi:putative FmdB family regulatory protein